MPHELHGYPYEFVPGTSGRTLLLLHGTGGDERDLLPLGRMVAPGDALVSPRGKVLENGMPRFFRRLAEGVLDVPDLLEKSHDMAEFLRLAAKEHGFDPSRVVALGYSNGANLAASILLQRPEALAGAALVRAMVPYQPDTVPDLSGKRVLLLAGRRDPYSGGAATETLAGLFRKGGAQVDVQVAEAGHELAQADVAAARGWLA
jgi:predicted esterase